MAKALLTYGDGDFATFLHRRVSPAMRRRISEHHDPATRDAHATFVRMMVERGVPTNIEELAETYGRPPEQLATDPGPDPRLRATVAQMWRARPIALQTAPLTDPDPGVRTAATIAEHPGVPPELHERCLADPATQANAARHLPLNPEQFARLVATGTRQCRRQWPTTHT